MNHPTADDDRAVDELVRRVIEQAPPLTADQLDQVRDLLPPPPPAASTEKGDVDAA